jgi:formate dehydrogenase
MHYYDKHRLPREVEQDLGLTFHPNVESLVKVSDVVTINTPLHPETEHMLVCDSQSIPFRLRKIRTF